MSSLDSIKNYLLNPENECSKFSKYNLFEQSHRLPNHIHFHTAWRALVFYPNLSLGDSNYAITARNYRNRAVLAT